MSDPEIRLHEKHDERGDVYYTVSCTCGFYHRAEQFPTEAGSHRSAILLAMTHNTNSHSYGYRISTR